MPAPPSPPKLEDSLGRASVLDDHTLVSSRRTYPVLHAAAVRAATTLPGFNRLRKHENM